MTHFTSLEEIVEAGYTLDLSRWLDAPVGPRDQILYTDTDRGRLLIARAPIVVSRQWPVVSERNAGR